MTITESIKFNKIKEENETLKKELAEKDKEIELMNEQCDGAIREILEQQLYKEDFEDIIICHNCDTLQEYCYMKDDEDNYHEYYRKVQFKNDDYWKYDKLPSKDVK